MNWLLQIAAVLTIAFSLLTAIDVPSRSVELFCHFRLQYFVVALLLAIVFAMLRNWPWAAALLLLTVFNSTFIVSWYLPVANAVAGTEQLKLFHANVYSGNRNYTQLIKAVDAEDPDIVLIQEVTQEWVAGTQALLKDYPYAYLEPRDGSFGIAVYSRIPFDSVSHIDSPPLDHPTIVARITRGGKPLTIISSHPTVPLGRFRFEARNEQLESLLQLVTDASGPVVLTGDFNVSVWAHRYRWLVASTGLRDARRGFGLLPTWPTMFPVAMIPIDHVLVSDDIEVLNLKTGHRLGSDHLPLVVTLSL